MSKSDPTYRFRHMLERARLAVSLCQGKERKALDEDIVLGLALVHLVEIIGEAAANVPKETQKKHPDIPWTKVIGVRNRLIHGYDSIDNDVLWDILKRNLPDLIKTLENKPPLE